jgi:hypothetical protein
VCTKSRCCAAEVGCSERTRRAPSGHDVHRSPERPPSRDIVDFYFLSFFLLFCRCPYRLALDTTRPPRHKTNTNYASQSHSFPLSLPSFSLILHLWSRTLEQRLPTLSHYHAASVCSLIHPHSPFPLYAYTLYSIPITGTSEIASTIQISYSSRMASTLISSNQVLPSFPSYFVLSIIGDPFVELLSTRSRPIPLSRLSFSD